MRWLRLLVMIPLLLIVEHPAAAANCTVAASDVFFGSYSAVTIDITGSVTVNCTSGAVYNVGIDSGTGAGATVTNRSLTCPPSGSLGYQLFTDAARTLNWGMTPGVDTAAGTGTGTSQNITVYARLPGNEYAPWGNCHDNQVYVYVTGSGFGTASAHFRVTADVIKACTVSASSMDFGAYSGLLINSTAAVSILCTSATAYDVGLDAGTAPGASVTNRRMTGPGATLLGYKLFRDSARSLNWGNTAGRDTQGGNGNGSVTSMIVYGQISAGQPARPGIYADTITATIFY